VPGGLQVRTRDGRWIDARTTPSRFVVNIGDLLMCWTNDRWLSNLHRVVKPPSTEPRRRPRLSIGFFNHPNYDALIASLSVARPVFLLLDRLRHAGNSAPDSGDVKRPPAPTPNLLLDRATVRAVPSKHRRRES
jgi:hypothetical protein